MRRGKAWRGEAWRGKARQGNMEHTALKKLRKELGLSLANAALQVHVTPRTWARYEKGDRKIPEGIVHLFCNENNIEYPLK